MIGLFVGSFNPPTKAHLEICEVLKKYFSKIVLVPVNSKNKRLIDINERIYMLNIYKDKNDFLEVNSIMKNYKSIIDTNKSIEIIKSNKVTSKDKNSYSAKHRMKKNKEKEIVSIKVEVNKELKSKEKNKFRNSMLNNRTEQQAI